jgi:glutamyl-tRNA reductase
MVFVACGLNHKTAPLTLREKLAITPSDHSQALAALMQSPFIDEAAILSTCNRTEIYCISETVEQVLHWLANHSKLPMNQLSSHAYLHTEHEALRHILRVASGLDSMMLGEPQILGQMKQAYRHASDNGTIGKKLRDVFEYTFSATKRIRTTSGIGVNPVSIAYAGVNLINTIFNDYTNLNVFLIGSGETSSLVAKYLIENGVKEIMIASRTQNHAEILAKTINGKGLTIGDIPDYLPISDIIISATACPLPFINKSLVERALIKRNHEPMFFLDLAIPRDIEEDVNELANVFLYNIDDLQSMVDDGMTERKMAARHAEKIIDYEINNYIRNHRVLRANDVICDYRDAIQLIAEKEISRSLRKLEVGKPLEQVLTEFCHRLVNKLAHNPTVGLRKAASDGRDDLLELAQYLFKESIN